MLNGDRRTKITLNSDYVCNYIDNINLRTLHKIQKDLPLYDLKSLVFLLYDIPATALQDIGRLETTPDPGSLSILRDWALDAKKTDAIKWKYKFLEALVVCRLFMVIRKLGFDVNEVRLFFKEKVNNVLSSVKKVLYLLCENIDINQLCKLKRTFETYKIKTNKYQSCESLLLYLMVEKVIYVDLLNKRYDLSKLIEVIEVFPTLYSFSNDLKILNVDMHSSLSSSSGKQYTENIIPCDKTDVESYRDINELVASLKMTTFENIKSDTKHISMDSYKIKNPKRVGTCYIINQEEFYPSNQSIKSHCKFLDNRVGSTKDKKLLEKTFQKLNFQIEISENLTHDFFLNSIRDIVNRVDPDDSIFVLCIMSHGIRGHIYTSDSIPISITDIQNVLGTESKNLHNIPKVMILQACQVDDDQTTSRIVSDSPKLDEYLGKSDFIIYWATAPELEAFRDTEKGSIFILLFCFMLHKYAGQENLYDIITKVNNMVSALCARLNKTQVPLFESTLRNKLYLKMPTY